MARKELEKPKGVSFKPLDALVAVLIVIALIMAHQMLVQLAGVIAVVTVVGAAGYVAYRVMWHHRFQMAELERYRMQTHILPGNAYGNYDAIYVPEERRVIRPELGHSYQVTPLNVATHYAPHIVESKTPLALPEPPAAPALIGKLALPGPLSFIDVMRNWQLSPDNLYLATGRGGQHLATDVDRFMHIAHDGPTGAGKTSQWKAELIMLLKSEVFCFLANPHFAPVTKKGEDWRPIAAALLKQDLPAEMPIEALLYTEETILDFLRWLAEKEIDRRFRLQRAGMFTYTPMYGFIDEWPAVVDKYPKAAEYMEDALQRGRAVEVFISANSQGFLTDDVGLNSAARANFQTAYWLGGSVISGSKMLNLSQKEITAILARLAEEGIKTGNGISLLRNDSVCLPASEVRLPHANNEYTYYMFGRADHFYLPGYENHTPRVSVAEAAAETLIDARAERAPRGEAINEEESAAPQGVSRNERTTGDLGTQRAGANVSTETMLADEAAAVKEAAAKVGAREKDAILRSIKLGLPYREVAAIAGMGSERYPIFRELLKGMGYNTSERNPYAPQRGAKQR